MKTSIYHLLFVLMFAWNALQGQTLFTENFETLPACDNSLPSDWYIVGTPTMSDSCTGYDLPHGFSAPMSGNHYMSIVTYDRTSPNHREFIGHTLSDKIYPTEQVYVEASVTLGDNCQWKHSGLAFSFTNGGWSATDSTCSEGIYPQVQMSSVFHGGKSWTLFGGFFTATDTLDRFQIGTFLCDEDLYVFRDTTKAVQTTHMNVDNITIHRMTVSVDRPQTELGEPIYCTDLYGRKTPCDSQGVVIHHYDGFSVKRYRLD